MNIRDNKINDLIKYDTFDQKVYLILLSIYNMHQRNNIKGECFISYIELKEKLKIKGKLSNTKIKKSVREFITDNTIDVKYNEDGLIVEYAKIVNENYHIIDIDCIIKCKSIQQMKVYILLSNNTNNFVYRNFLATILGIDITTIEQRKNATKNMKRIFDSLIKNEIIKSFSYDSEEKKYNIEHSKIKKISQINEEYKYFSEENTNTFYLNIVNKNR